MISSGKNLAFRLDWATFRLRARKRSDCMISRDLSQPTLLSLTFIGKPFGDLSVFFTQKWPAKHSFIKLALDNYKN